MSQRSVDWDMELQMSCFDLSSTNYLPTKKFDQSAQTSVVVYGNITFRVKGANRRLFETEGLGNNEKQRPANITLYQQSSVIREIVPFTNSIVRLGIPVRKGRWEVISLKTFCQTIFAYRNFLKQNQILCNFWESDTISVNKWQSKEETLLYFLRYNTILASKIFYRFGLTLKRKGGLEACLWTQIFSNIFCVLKFIVTVCIFNN
ncbi:hypothetical protein BY458DRAFT_486774 [Sporodiniella umbellata]|nr:hypothetical protein BY458DRAFT_486774 [Sporodiniella umbellata]